MDGCEDKITHMHTHVAHDLEYKKDMLEHERIVHLWISGFVQQYVHIAIILLSRPDFHRCSLNTELNIRYPGEIGVNMYENKKYFISDQLSRLSAK